MTAWWIDRLQDFIPFEARTYWRLIEAHNESIWPLHVVGLVVGGVFLLRVLRSWSGRDRPLAAVLAGVWAWVAWSFLVARYGTLHWLGSWLAGAFLVEAALLVWFGTIRGTLTFGGAEGRARKAAITLIAFAVLLHPVTALLSGRSAASAEVFGLTADPTAIATLGLLAAGPRAGPRRWLLLIPIVWCVFSAFTLLALGSWLGWIPLAGVAVALAGRTGGGG